MAEEQAAVNAFRMHCRLELDDLVDRLLDLQAQKQACLTRLELLRQGFDPAWLEEDDLLHEEEGPEADIESQGQDWWSLVRLELGQAIDRRKGDIVELQLQLECLVQRE